MKTRHVIYGITVIIGAAIPIGFTTCTSTKMSSTAPGSESIKNVSVTSQSVPAKLTEYVKPVEVFFVEQKKAVELADWERYGELIALASKDDDCCTFTISSKADKPTKAALAEADRIARSVREQLILKGVDASRVIVADIGDALPCCSDKLGVEIAVRPLAEKETSLKYFWNAWAEDKDPGEEEKVPVPTLELNTTYVLTVHLAGTKYPEKGIVTVEVARKFGSLIEGKANKTTEESLSFTPLLLLDPAYFRTPSQVLKPVNIDLTLVRKALSETEISVDSGKTSVPLEQQVPFARLEQFEITTHERTGYAAIGLSIWQDERPMDEVAFPFCIGRNGDRSDCRLDAVATSGLGGTILFDSVSGSSASTNLPDAALHIIELSAKLVMGVLYRRNVGNEADRYIVWKIGHDTDDFRSNLKQRQEAFGRVTGDPEGVGRDLANVLFPNDVDGNRALSAFNEFFEPYQRPVPFSDMDRPTIFARYLRDRSGPLLYPLGLINPSAEPNGFVGYHARVETPLPLQRYDSGNGCLSDWLPVVPMPSSDPDLTAAHTQISRRVKRISPWDPATGFLVSTVVPPVSAYTEMKPFHRWISERESEPGTILTILSHHHENALFFDAEESEVSAKSVQKTFADPAAVILAGCSTGAPGARALIGELNRAGVDSVISTNTGISGELAGDFVECFMQQIESTDNVAGVHIGKAFDDAQKCVYAIKDPRDNGSLYGPQILSFTFAGNPFLRLCPPEG